MTMRYWTQTQAPNGNWVDVLGSDDLDTCKGYADFQQDKLGRTARVIARTDEVVYIVDEVTA